jgi:serpin B
MAYAGAGGETETQMAEALSYRLPQERLHPAINALALSLASRSAEQEDDPGRRFRLVVANAAWGQSGTSFVEEYLNVLGRYYGTGLRLLDFESDPEGARQAINTWVSDRTAGLIEELIPEGIINTMTRLVLTNAVYFRASWMYPFDDANTTDDTFQQLDGSEMTTLFMEQTEEFDYTEGDGFQAVELPYVGDEVSMVVIAPEPERFAEFEEALNSDRAASIMDELQRTNVTLSMPLFEFSSDLPVSDALKEMGMTAAFSPEEADFSGIDGTMRLFVRDVLHKGFVSVDESGTEATAATAVVIEEESLPPEPIEMEIDSPFIFLIRDTETGTILFLGRVLSPEAHLQVR